MRRSSDGTPRLLPAALLPLLLILVPACGGSDDMDDEPIVEVPDGDAPETDHWLEEFAPYITDEFRAAYLATPPEERFRVHGAQLSDFNRREFILEDARVDLSREELERYYRLPDADACQAYVAELEAQPGRVTAPAPTMDPAPDPAPTDGPDPPE